MKRKGMTRTQYTEQLKMEARMMSVGQLWNQLDMLAEVYKAQMLCTGNLTPKLNIALKAYGNELQFRITGEYPL